MATVKVKCPHCGGIDVVKNGRSKRGEQRYFCRKVDCRSYFILNYIYNGSKPGVDEQIIKMAANASGIRDTARVLGISTDKVMNTLKKTASAISRINYNYYSGIKQSKSFWHLKWLLLLLINIKNFPIV